MYTLAVNIRKIEKNYIHTLSISGGGVKFSICGLVHFTSQPFICSH